MCLQIYEIGGGSGTCAKGIMDYIMLNAPTRVYNNMTYTYVLLLHFFSTMKLVIPSDACIKLRSFLLLGSITLCIAHICLMLSI